MSSKDEQVPAKSPVQQDKENPFNAVTQPEDERGELSYDRSLDQVEGKMNNGETGGFTKR